MEPTSFQSPLPPPRSLDYELSNILTRLSDCESYVSGWVSTLLQTTEALQFDIAAIKEQKPTAPPPLSFRQLVELHHLQIISKDEIRSLLRVPEALAETNQEWTSLFTIDSEPKSALTGQSLVDVIPTTQADNQAINNALDTLFPPSPPEPDL